MTTLGALLDVFRLRQYFNAITRTREWVEGLRQDAGLLTDAARAAMALPAGRVNVEQRHPFPAFHPYSAEITTGQRIAPAATVGSGAMASLVGAARALEEAGLRPALITMDGGSLAVAF